MKRRPKLCHHKRTNRAYVLILGKRKYLGEWGSQEAKSAYQAELDRLDELGSVKSESQEYHTTIRKLCLEFLKWAEVHYPGGEGSRTREVDGYRTALKELIRYFGSERCADFGPSKLIRLRDEVFVDRHVRTMVNRQIYRIRRVFKWGVSRELVPATVLVKLQTVEGLQAGRTRAKESEGVKPVPQEHIDAVLPLLTSPLADMLRLQLLTGARPSEIRLMRAADIDRSDSDVWLYHPRQHKNAWRGKPRTIFIAKKGQAILSRYLLGKRDDDYVFRPIDGRRDYVQKHYRENAIANVRNLEDENQPYTLTGMSSSIRKACKKANVPAWSPGQLRHNAATAINATFKNLDAARTVLGHSEISTTQRYAELDIESAKAIAKKIG